MTGLFLAFAAAAAAQVQPAPFVVAGNSPAAICADAAQARSEDASAMIACNDALATPLSARERVATLNNRGALELIASRFAAAETDFDAAIALQPTEAEAWLNKALSQQTRGDSLAAIASFDKALALGTHRPELALLGRGLAHEKSGDLHAAYADLQRARELAPAWQPATAELARYQIKR